MLRTQSRTFAAPVASSNDHIMTMFYYDFIFKRVVYSQCTRRKYSLVTVGSRRRYMQVVRRALNVTAAAGRCAARNDTAHCIYGIREDVPYRIGEYTISLRKVKGALDAGRPKTNDSPNVKCILSHMAQTPRSTPGVWRCPSKSHARAENNPTVSFERGTSKQCSDGDARMTKFPHTSRDRTHE